MEKFARDMNKTTEGRTALQRFIDAIREFIDKVRAAFEGNQAQMNQKAMKDFGATMEQLETATKLWQNIIDGKQTEAVESKAETKNTTETDGVMYSIKETADGIKYVTLDGNIFIKNDGTEMTPREAYNALIGHKITLEDGDTITFIKKLPNIDLYKELFRKLPGYEPGIDVKAISENINKNIVEVITASNVEIRNEAQRHPHIGIKDFEQRNVYLYDGNEVYKLELNIANLTDNTKIAYVKRFIEKAEVSIEDKIKKAETAGQTRLNQLSNGRNQNEVDSSNTKISQPDNTVKTKNENTEMHSSKGDSLDRAYMDAVNSGDTEAAQKMVDEAGMNLLQSFTGRRGLRPLQHRVVASLPSRRRLFYAN